MIMHSCETCLATGGGRDIGLYSLYFGLLMTLFPTDITH